MRSAILGNDLKTLFYQVVQLHRIVIIKIFIGKLVIPTLASKTLSTPSSIVLTSPYLRPRPNIVIITRELTDCVVIHYSILWASKFYSIGWCRQRWASVRCSTKKERKDNLNEQVNLPGVKRTVYFWKECKNFTKLEEAIITSFLYPNAKYPWRALRDLNTPFRSSLLPRYEKVAVRNHSCANVGGLQVHFHEDKKLISILEVLHEDSFWNRGKR